MRSARLEGRDVERLLGMRGRHARTSGWSDVATLLSALRSDPVPGEVAAEAQAVVAIAAVIRSHPGTPASNLAALRSPAKRRGRSATERLAASFVAAVLAGTTALVVVGGFPHSAVQSAAGVGTGTRRHGSVHRPGGAGAGLGDQPSTGRTSTRRSTSTAMPDPNGAKSGVAATGRTKPATGGGHRSRGQRFGTGSGTGSSPDGGRTRGGDRGNGKDRGKGNDGRLDRGGRRESKTRHSRSGGHHN